VRAGDSKWAIDVLKTYMRLDPFCAPIATGFLGLAHYMLKKYSQALPILRDYVSQAPKSRAGHMCLAATHAQLGQLEEARAEAAEVLVLQPNYTIARTTRPGHRVQVYEGRQTFLRWAAQSRVPE
jgi:adenylate cyclase